ncbi:MAG: iron ABC transporter permease [Solobacterium sp.]|nr:iron ABC transporter permease [Solobacterium sp.]
MILIGFILLLFVVFVCSLSAGYSQMNIFDVLRILSGNGEDRETLILFSFRLPRICVAMLAGTGLALSGCILQDVTGNELAEPGLLGINAGAGVSVILYTLLFRTGSFLSVFIMPFCALIGGCGAAVLIYVLSKSRKGLSNSRLILTGLAVEAGLSALTTLLVVRLDDRQYQAVQTWQAGSIWAGNWNYVIALLPWLLCIIPYVLSRSDAMDVLLLGDEAAAGLGVDISKEKKSLLFASVALAAASVALSGSIGFVGLIAPHLSKKLVGSKHVFLLPACALIGAVLVTSADAVARTIMQPEEIPAGIVVAIIGTPYFLYLLMKERTA